MPEKYPHRVKMHYDPNVDGVWIGLGTDLNAVCGQSEFIGVTNNIAILDCAKCRAIIAKDRSATS